MKLKRVIAQDGRYYYIQDLEERNPRTGRPKQKWHALTRVDAGQDALIKALDELLGKAPARQGNMKCHIEEFTKGHYPSVTPLVRGEYERMFEVINEGFKPFDSADVEPGDVIDFLQENFSTKLNMRSKYKGLLSQFFSWCVLNSHTGVKVNPCREIKMSRPKKRKGKMNDGIYWKMHDALTPMGRCFLELCFYSIQRPTEIRLLRDSHIGPPDFPNYIHFVPTKTEDSTALDVHVLITPEIRGAIERARALRPKKKQEKVVDLRRRADPFIIQTRTGDGYTKNGLYEVWRDGLEKAELLGRNITTRDIRPYAMKKLEDLGYDLRAIQKAAVHSTVTTTEGYLEQHRDRLSDVRLTAPARPK